MSEWRDKGMLLWTGILAVSWVLADAISTGNNLKDITTCGLFKWLHNRGNARRYFSRSGHYLGHSLTCVWNSLDDLANQCKESLQDLEELSSSELGRCTCGVLGARRLGHSLQGTLSAIRVGSVDLSKRVDLAKALANIRGSRVLRLTLQGCGVDKCVDGAEVDKCGPPAMEVDNLHIVVSRRREKRLSSIADMIAQAKEGLLLDRPHGIHHQPSIQQGLALVPSITSFHSLQFSASRPHPPAPRPYLFSLCALQWNCSLQTGSRFYSLQHLNSISISSVCSDWSKCARMHFSSRHLEVHLPTFSTHICICKYACRSVQRKYANCVGRDRSQHYFDICLALSTEITRSWKLL